MSHWQPLVAVCRRISEVQSVVFLHISRALPRGGRKEARTTKCREEVKYTSMATKAQRTPDPWRVAMAQHLEEKWRGEREVSNSVPSCSHICYQVSSYFRCGRERHCGNSV